MDTLVYEIITNIVIDNNLKFKKGFINDLTILIFYYLKILKIKDLIQKMCCKDSIGNKCIKTFKQGKIDFFSQFLKLIINVQGL